MSRHQNAGRSPNIKTDNNTCESGTVQISGNSFEESKIYSRRN